MPSVFSLMASVNLVNTMANMQFRLTNFLPACFHLVESWHKEDFKESEEEDDKFKTVLSVRISVN